MTGWEIIACGIGAIALGAFLLYGFDRGWFSNHYTYTIEGGEGFMFCGLLLVAVGAVVVGLGTIHVI